MCGKYSIYEQYVEVDLLSNASLMFLNEHTKTSGAEIHNQVCRLQYRDGSVINSLIRL